MKKFISIFSVLLLSACGGGSSGSDSPTPPPVNTNATPAANAESFQLNEDESISDMVTGTDADGDSLSFSLVSDVENGQLQLNSDGSFEYTPNENFNGMDSFDFSVNDGQVDSTPVSIELNVLSVNDLPIADVASFELNEDGSVSGMVSGSDVDGDPLTFVINSDVTNGQLELNADGAFVYTPNGNFNGMDSFSFSVNDGEVDSTTASIELNVLPVNDLPIANAASLELNEDEPLSSMATGTDADGDSLSFMIVSDVVNGQLQLNTDGSFVYTPNENYVGADSFTFSINDGQVNSNTASIELNVLRVNALPIANAGNFQLNEDESVSGFATGTDPEGDPITFAIASEVSNGQLELNTDGSFLYTPTENFNGVDSFDFIVNDGQVDSFTASIELNVVAVNDLPIAENDLAYSAYQSTLIISPLENDSDVDGDQLTISIQQMPQNGTLQITSDTLEYTPNNSFVGADVIQYEISDGAGGTAQATINISVRRLVGFLKEGKLWVRHPYSPEEPVQLSHNLGEDFSVFVRTFEPSINGQYIYYTLSEEPEGLETINLYRVEVANPDNVIKISDNIQPGGALNFYGDDRLAFYLSPDGSKVAYTAYVSRNGDDPVDWGFYIANIENDAVQSIDRASSNIVVFGEFTGDSQYLYVRRVDDESSNVQNLYRIDTQNANSHQLINSKPLTSTNSVNRNKPQFEISEDGDSIFYRALTRFNETEVYQASFLGGFNNRPISAQVTTNLKTVSEFIMLPNSERVVYPANHESTTTRKDFYLSGANGSTVASRVNLPLNYNLEGVKDLNSAVSHDSNMLAYVIESSSDENLFVGNLAVLPDQRQVSESAEGENAFEFTDPQFSEDNGIIYYLRSNTGESPLLYKTSLDTLGQSELVSDATDRPFSRVVLYSEGDLGEVIFCGLAGFPSDGCRIYLKNNEPELVRVDSVEDVEDGLGGGFGNDIFKLIPRTIN